MAAAACLAFIWPPLADGFVNGLVGGEVGVRQRLVEDGLLHMLAHRARK